MPDLTSNLDFGNAVRSRFGGKGITQAIAWLPADPAEAVAVVLDSRDSRYHVLTWAPNLGDVMILDSQVTHPDLTNALLDFAGYLEGTL